MSKTTCIGCGNIFDTDENDGVCVYCGTVANATEASDDVISRLSMAAAYRRVGRFEDSQQELENILEMFPEDRYPEVYMANFGCFLNAYEVTEYSFDKKSGKVSLCKCNSTSRRPVENNIDWQFAHEKARGKQLAQWEALVEKIDELRAENIDIKDNIPSYRAIIICDYSDGKAMEAAHAIYDELSQKTDVFFTPKTLAGFDHETKDRYLAQVMKNPEIAPLMFVVYSDRFNYRSKAPNYHSNIVRQCRDFAKVHAKSELFSVFCDSEPSPIMKAISTKTIRCKSFEPAIYGKLADKVMENILECAYTFEEMESFENGERMPLDEDLGFSPVITL